MTYYGAYSYGCSRLLIQSSHIHIYTTAFVTNVDQIYLPQDYSGYR